MNYLTTLLATSGPNLDSAIKPVYDIVGVVLPILLGIVFAIGMFKCITLGIAFSKSDENGTHEKAKKDLINAIVGFVIIFVLIGVLYLVREPLIEWIASLTGDWNFSE